MVAWRAHDSGLIYLKPHQLPCKELGNIKEWLDDSDIKFTEGPLNFNWKSIMKTINEDFSGFLETGGWSFLEENDEGEGEEEMDVDDMSDEFQVSEGELEEDDVSSEEFEEDDDEDFDDDEEDDEDFEDGEDGEDWEDLEEQALEGGVVMLCSCVCACDDVRVC
eukprot:TRINITY_DN12532_c0_g1_i13.p3 TRINITY_DN12532_c0_g1~~TRINITY_DN12532_c0_g1_i13.p3  ORF type:complete len:164 (+),score=60.27 TRINITY_DN12532_c0_g1_i13:293-784(+)